MCKRHLVFCLLPLLVLSNSVFAEKEKKPEPALVVVETKVETITADPTRPLSWQRAVGGKYQKQLTLNSVLISDARKVAIINGRRVTVSGMVDGAKVIVIRDGEVVVSRGGVRQILKLKPNPVKRVVRK